MSDVVMLVLIAVFFGVCIAYVSWCDRIIGPDPAEAGADAVRDIDANDGGRAANDPTVR